LPKEHEIRADYDRETIVVYQAYPHAIADAAVAAGRFVPPFSLNRMTWIKPSFLWLMHRSNWGQSGGQERTMAVRIRRSGWVQALSEAVLTAFEPSVHRSREEWRKEFEAAPAYVQWDPERTIRGTARPYGSIQVGIGRQVIEQYVNEWTVGIEDLSARVANMRELIRSGNADVAKRLLPREKAYPLAPVIGRRILIDS
jgi:hypothetical protein